MELSCQFWDHVGGNFQNTLAVDQVVQGILSFFQLKILVLNKGFLLGDILLHVFEEEIVGLLLVVLVSLELLHELISALRWSNLDVVLYALVCKILQFSFALLT